MARLARAEIFEQSEIAAVHLIGKTVRSCFLMGFDERSGPIGYDSQPFERYFLVDAVALSVHCHAV